MMCEDTAAVEQFIADVDEWKCKKMKIGDVSIGLFNRGSRTTSVALSAHISISVSTSSLAR